MAQLEIIEGREQGRKFQVEPGRLLVGRGQDCDIRLNESSVSRHHAVLLFDGGVWTLEDLDSQNGTFVEGTKVTNFELPKRASVRFGTVILDFDPSHGAGQLYVTGEDAQDDGDVAPPEFAAAVTGRIDDMDELPDVLEETVPPVAPPKAVSGPPVPELVPEGPSEEMISDIRQMEEIYPIIEAEFGRMIIGQRAVLEELLTAIAAGGHCLMVGLPGLAKTLMIRTLASILQLNFRRIQFTPDLMPSDIIGTDVLETDEATGQKTFRFVKGPIFTNMLLADEINRTPPKTQAALLESMQERQVTVANHVFPLPPPFFVLATQNPLEQEGTYPLPEAQLDRFMFNVIVDYPEEDEEEAIVAATTGRQDVDLREILGAQDLLNLQATVRELPVSPHIIKYATRLTRCTRPKTDGAPQFIKDYVYCGAGPRAAQFLILGAKARAVIHGRVNVSSDDIRALAPPVLRHRIFMNFTADSEGISTDDLISKLLLAVPEPDQNDY